MPAPKKIDWTPPERLAEAEHEVWEEMVGRGRMHPSSTPEMLETYCSLIVRWRAAADKVRDEGLVVADEKRGAVVHPALAAERELADQVRKWTPLFNRPTAARRRSGPMYDATKRSITAALIDSKPEFEAICDAVLTYAWLIDEAQREGIEALQKATYNLIPSYVKGCAELQITPASLPAEAAKKGRTGGRLGKFQQGAQDRRLEAVG